jgi:hypothetical protein
MRSAGPPPPNPQAWYAASIAAFLPTPAAQVIGSLAASSDFKDAIRKVSAYAPILGDDLQRANRTGTFCAYLS